MPWPPALSWAIPVHAACAVAAPSPSTGPHISPRIACPPFDSAARVQPAAELRHLQRHDHVSHVPGALRACPLAVQAACAAAASLPPASRLSPRPASHALLSTRQSAYAFNQPLSFDTSKVTEMSAMFTVRSAYACHFSWTLPVCMSLAPSSRHALSPPGPPLAPHRMPPLRLGSTRMRSTSR